jgi:hypothetical protein
MSRYDDDYDDNEDEQPDDPDDDGGGIRRSTSNPFSKPSSVRGAGLPQRPPPNADGSVPSPIRSGGGSNSSSLLPNRPGGASGSGGSSGVQPFQRSPANRDDKKDDENDRTAAVNRVLGSFSHKLGQEDDEEEDDGDIRSSGSNPFANSGLRVGGNSPDNARQRSPSNSNSNSPFGPRQNESDNDKTGIGGLTRGLGGTPSRLGGGNDEKKDNNRSSDMIGGLTNRIGGGGGNDKKDDRGASKPAGGGLGGLTNRFGGDDKKDDKKDNKPGGGLGGLTNRFGGGDDKKDDKNAKPAGGGLGGLTNRFGGGDKKDDKKDNKPSSGNSSSPLGGLTNRFGGGGDKKEDKNAKPAGGGALGGLTNRFGGGDKKEDKPASGGGAFGSRSNDSSMQRQSPLDQSQRQSPLDQSQRGQSALGGSLSRGTKPETSSGAFGGGANASSTSRTPFGGSGGANPAKPMGGAKKPAPSLSERLKGLNPFGAKAEKAPAPRSRTSKTPKVDQGGLTLDNKLDIVGVTFLLGSLILLLSSLSPTKGALTESVNRNLSYVFGWGAAFVLLVIFAVGGWLILRHFGDEAPVLSRTRLIGLLMLFVGALVMAQFIDSFQYQVGAGQDYLRTIKNVFLSNAYTSGRGGGWIGGEIYYLLLANFGEIGGFMVVIGWLLVAVMLTLSVSASDLAIIVVSNGRNLRDVLQQRQKRAAAVRAEKQQALALAAQQISVLKPAVEGVPAAVMSPALPAPSVEEQRRNIPITTAGRTSSVPFRAQEAALGAEPVPVVAAVAAPVAKAGGLFGGLGSRVRGVLPKAGDKPDNDAEKKPAAAEKAASLRSRLMNKSETVALGETPAAAPVSASQAAGMMSPMPSERLSPTPTMPERSAQPAMMSPTPTERLSPTMPTMPPLGGDKAAEKPAGSDAARLGDLLRRSPAPSGATPTSPLSPTERLSPTPTSPLSPTPLSPTPTSPLSPMPNTPASPGGVQPFPRSPLIRPDAPAASLNGSSSAEVTPAQAKPDWKSRMEGLRSNGENKPAAATMPEPTRSAPSPAFGKPADPPFMMAEPSAPAANGDTPAPPITRSRPPRNWNIPDPTVLLATGVDQAPDHEMLLKRAHIIEETLSSFGAPGRVVDVRTGPVVTQFGVEPDYVPGRGGKKNRVKVGAIAALDKDLQLALGAKAIRIEAPVPGKGYVGVEVPNAKPEIVHLRDVLESAEFKKIKSPLGLALGQGVDGTPVAADLAAAPHLLIAGTTGSGKSVLVNAIIASLLLKNSPKQVKFVMVDPKRVELTQYNGIPHLVAPVVVELERIVSVLKWVTREMDERYRKFSNAAARNIEDYNKHLPATEEQMPYIVVIIDELADLMMLAPDDTERTITRIAALARATGIHLVIATQRPSVDVVTGLIKANFPSRVAFAVAGNTDSRVILDQPGAERLLGRGDMLYMSGDSPAPVRLQGVWVSDNEISQITRFWRSQMTEQDLIAASRPMGASIAGDSTRSEGGGVIMKNNPRPQSEAFWEEDDDEDTEDDEDALADGEDAMYEQAVDMVRRLNKASVSLLQRRLRIGYTRAARLIDTMEERGIVGPPVDGAKPREVLPVR